MRHHMKTYIYIYIHTYTERERERDVLYIYREREREAHHGTDVGRLGRLASKFTLLQPLVQEFLENDEASSVGSYPLQAVPPPPHPPAAAPLGQQWPQQLWPSLSQPSTARQPARRPRPARLERVGGLQALTLRIPGDPVDNSFYKLCLKILLQPSVIIVR